MRKVAIIGASGLLGRAVASELAKVPDRQVVQTAHRRADAGRVPLNIRDHDAIGAFLRAKSPDAVVVTAAERRPDVCENDPALFRALNVDALSAIAGEARQSGAWV